MQPKEERQRLGVAMMAKRVVGPSPPEPNWDRLDLRGINSTRSAWGYIAADDSAIVSDDGKVFIRIDRSMVEKPKNGKGILVKIIDAPLRVLQRCLRWSKIIKQMYDFEQESPAEEDLSVTPPKPEKSLSMKPRKPTKKLSISRFRDETDDEY
jgi:hypothetical protein